MIPPGKGEGTSKRILPLSSPAHILRFIESYCASKSWKVDSTEVNAIRSYQNVIGIIGRPIEIKALSSYLQESNKPQKFDAAEREKLVATLRKWEMGAAIGEIEGLLFHQSYFTRPEDTRTGIMDRERNSP